MLLSRECATIKTHLHAESHDEAAPWHIALSIFSKTHSKSRQVRSTVRETVRRVYSVYSDKILGSVLMHRK